MPKKTTVVIKESGNDYILGVKKNQPTLHDQIESIINDVKKVDGLYTTIEVNKGRTELRCVKISNQIQGIHEGWIGAQTVVGVHRIVKTKNKISEEMAYFISSRKENAMFFSEGVRSHWEIENSLHWVKDVTLKEDASKIVKGKSAQNISIIRNIAINLFRKNDFTGIAKGIRLVCNDINFIFNMII